jgi:hypothetical protein
LFQFESSLDGVEFVSSKMFFSAWTELDLDSGLCRIYVPKISFTLSVSLCNGYLVVRDGEEIQYSFRLGSASEKMEVLSAHTLASLTTLTLRFSALEALSFSERWPEPPLVTPLTCRACGTCVVPAGRKAFLIPSLLWGFEEVRACEECAPMQPCGKSRRTQHGQRIYVGERSVFVGDGVLSTCSGCGKAVGRDVVPLTPFLSDLGVEGQWTEVSKFSVTCDQLEFLQAYTTLAEIGGAVEKFYVDNEEQRTLTIITSVGNICHVRILGTPIALRPLEGEKLPGENSTRTARCIRVLLNFEISDATSDSAQVTVAQNHFVDLMHAVEKFPAPQDLWPRTDAWQLFYLPLYPEMDD